MGSVIIEEGNSLIEEDRLRQISRAVRQHVPSDATTETSSDQIKLFQRLLDDVFYTSSFPSLNGSHRVAAWNTLCSIIDQSLESSESIVKDYVWNGGIWERALALYLEHAQSARPKSSRQLLSTLTNALRKQPSRDLTELKGGAVGQLLTCLMDYEDPSRAKVSAQLLSSLLQKDLVSTDVVLTTVTRLGSIRATTSEGSPSHNLLRIVFTWMSKGDFGASITTLVSIILDKLDETASRDPSSNLIWLEPLLASISQGAVHIDDLRAHLFPVLFKRKFNDFLFFLDSQGLTQTTTSSTTGNKNWESASQWDPDLLYAALQSGKELGLLYETDSDRISYTPSVVLLPLYYIEVLLTKNSRSARLTGLYLLTTSHSSTRPLSKNALSLIRRSLTTSFADVDADFRSEVFGSFQRLVDRMRSTTKTLTQQTTAPTKQQLLQDHIEAQSLTLKHHKDFLDWLLRFLCWELRPTASYQRHISALKCLMILAQSGLDKSAPVELWSKSALRETKWSFEMRVLTLELQQLLLNLLLDPFDDVRQTAAAVLRIYSKSEQVSQTSDLYVHALARAEEMMYLTGRADQADGVAHLYALSAQSTQSSPRSSVTTVMDEVVQKLEDLLSIARKDLATAVERYPLHGLLTSLRYIMTTGNALCDPGMRSRLFKALQEVWDLVKPVLCNDAPEGYVPEELEDAQDSTKETLSYCWRALKESSLLLSTMISMPKATNEGNDNSLLEQMSQLCFAQLSELRHRGAFSTVAQTWVAVCNRCKDLRSTSGTSMLEMWYGEVVQMLRTNVTINTRRSAGLPSLLCGLLIADKTETLTAKAFTDLDTIARQEVDTTAAEEGSLAQVHAMNCHKDMLKNSRLGEQTERYIPDSLRLAADALQSDAWAIRNCGLMLFRAVIDRLLGTSEAHFEDDHQVQKRISMEQNPQLLGVVLGLLAPPIQEASARYEGVFPALQMLQLMRVPRERLTEVRAAIGGLIAVPSWHVRDKAARTLASLMSVRELSQLLSELLEQSNISENALHGSLLAVKYTLLRAVRQTTNGTETECLAVIESCTGIAIATGRLFDYAYSPVTQAAAIRLIQECSALLATVDSNYEQPRLITALWSSTAPDGVTGIFRDIIHPLLNDPGAAVVRQAWARLLAQYLSVNPHEAREHSSTYRQLVIELSVHDEDAGKYFLLAVQNVKVDASGPISAIVMQLCMDIMCGQLGVELQCEAQRAILFFSEKSTSKTEFPSMTSKEYLSAKECSQCYADQWLQLQSLQLDCHGHGAVMEQELISDISSWAEECIHAIDGSGIHTREAAAAAIDRVDTLWTTLHSTENLQSHFLRLCVAVYDLLNDDDEDIRLQASRVTSRILATASEKPNVSRAFEFEPITASQKLLAFCVRRWPASGELISTAYLRAFNIGERESRSVADQLAEAMHGDTALFAEEKQNLYIDEANEVKVWSRVAQKLNPNALPNPLLTNLANWVDEGLQTLTAHARDTPDGALGWSTHADVFTLGLQVFYGAEALLSLAEKGVRIPLRPSEVRKKLFGCLSASESGGGTVGVGQVNCLWRREVERILTEAVERKVKRVGGEVEEVFRGRGRGSGQGRE